MNSFFGLNVHAQGLKNLQRVLDYHKNAKPVWSLIMDGVGLGALIKAASPTTNVIIREYQEDGAWYKKTPADYLAFIDQKMGDFDGWSFVENEAGLNIDWNVQLIKLNAMRVKPRKLVILNLSVGTPEPDAWRAARALLDLCNTYREWVVIGLHEYCCGLITSGFIGGAPNDSRHADFTKLINWPDKATVQTMTKWHCGRFMFLVNTCRDMGIAAPRLVLTEHGFDDVSDIKAWASTLPVTPPYTSIRGFKSLTTWWKRDYPQWASEDQAYFMNMSYGADNIYAGSPVEGACLYCCGHVDAIWQQFDIEGHEELFKDLEAYALKTTAPPIPPPPPVIIPTVRPKPANALTAQNIYIKRAIHVRYDSTTSSLNIAYQSAVEELQPGDQATIWTDSATKDGAGRTWVFVHIHTGDFQGKDGWVSLTDLKFDPLATGEVPVVTEPPPVVVTPPPVPIPPVNNPPAPNMPNLKAAYDLLNTIDIQLTSIQQELRAVKDILAQQINLATVA